MALIMLEEKEVEILKRNIEEETRLHFVGEDILISLLNYVIQSYGKERGLWDSKIEPLYLKESDVQKVEGGYQVNFPDLCLSTLANWLKEEQEPKEDVF